MLSLCVCEVIVCLSLCVCEVLVCEVCVCEVIKVVCVRESIV